MMSNDPTVSVWMISYNHEKFIGKAIESVLSQKTNFKIEIVIGDDSSTDNTREIIKAYQKKHPNIIRARFNKTNIGMMANMIATLNECEGKYIALLEGDDYWTYPQKLQEQVNFLENNLNYSFSFHNALIVQDGSNTPPHIHADLREGDYLGNQIIVDWIVPTASVVFRNEKINWPPFSSKCAHGDILLFLLLLEHGKAYAFNEVWSVYRKNEKSVTLINSIELKYIKKVIRQQILMNRFFKMKYHEAFKERLRYWKIALLSAQLTKRQYRQFLISSIAFLSKDPLFLVKKMTKKLI